MAANEQRDPIVRTAALRGEPSRYVVGIDLGTTNSAVAYVDTAEMPWRVRTFPTPQLVAPGQVESRDTLPSFHYQPAPGEMTDAAWRMPWDEPPARQGGGDATHVVGILARDHGRLSPGRLIASAKSWMCHSGVDRTADLLPWHAADDVERLSPVKVSSRYLAHVRAAWDARFRHHPLAEQDVVITLPASFDEVARELTVKAAARAGLARVVLIEEPQAAFYAWVYAHADDWQRHVLPGQKILVCDIGGGTSDFTLIRVRRAAAATAAKRTADETGAAGETNPASSPGKIQFHRVAVGEHLILGGDNLDLALAQHVERRLVGDGKLDPRPWAVLVRTCQQVKETLLGPAAPERLTVSLPGSGSRLVGGALSVELTRDEVERVLVDGFFPRVPLDARPMARRSGFQEFGLPFTPDPAVTKYLAAFLTAHRYVALDDVALDDMALEDVSPNDAGTDERDRHDPARPDVVLFNGGLFASEALRGRLLEVLRSWFPTADTPNWQPLILNNDRLDLAVARGAAYYGMVRRGQGVRIAAGLARTYYIGVAGEETTALCLVPASTQPGEDVELPDRRFDLLVSEPVEFPLYVSSTRLTDRPGELAPIDRETMTSLPPIRTVLRTSKRGDSGVVPVTLHARLTEIGTLDLWCAEVDGRRSWRLQFDVRSATQTDVAAHQGAAEREGFIDEPTWERCRTLIRATFDVATAPTSAATASSSSPGVASMNEVKPDELVKRLSEAIGANRDQWPSSLLRRMWESLVESESGRRRSPIHEARWLNLLGFALRPGFGLAVDDWRVAETWRLVQGKLVHRTQTCLAESWILWRRIAGGLAAGQQKALADPLVAPIRNLHRRTTTGQGRGDVTFDARESAEAWRLLGSLELLSVATKIELAGMLLDLLFRPKLEPARGAMTWALGRIAARAPVYGPLNAVVPPDVAAEWLRKLMAAPIPPRSSLDAATNLAVMQIARRTDDRYRDLPEKIRGEALRWLADHDAPAHLLQLVRDGGTLDVDEQGRVFGEALPKGLRIQ